MTETKQMVVFTLGEADFGFPIEHVSEIIKYIPVTDIPNSSPYVEGACNLRGKIHVILNIKSILGLDKKTNGDKSYIIVADEFDAGVIVDEVKMIITPALDDIVSVESLPKYINNQNILYIVKNDDKLIYVLNFKDILFRSLTYVTESSQWRQCIMESFV